MTALVHAALGPGAEPLSPGALVDSFRVTSLAHRGAMALLYRVEVASGQAPAFPLLMKIPRLGNGQSAEGVLGFETERAVLPKLHGPHVPGFVAAGDVEHGAYLVMEAVEGISLATIMTSEELPPDRIARLGIALADALHAVHRQGAVHLDFKPDNVIVRPNGVAVLIDFGLAHHEWLPDLLAEERRFAAGSSPYLAPEQLLGVRSDRRSDVFALGVVLYELATGELPFGIPATEAGLRDRLWREPVPPRALRSSLPPWLQEIILRCLEVDAEHRYQSAAHVAFDFRHHTEMELTARADRTRRPGFFVQFRHWWHARQRAARPRPLPRATFGDAPVVLVAVDTMHPEDERHPVIRRAAENVLAFGTDFRMICVAVVAPPAAGDSDGAVVDHRVRLMRWCSPLALPPHRLTLHVLEAPDPARALLDFAALNLVDLIVLGAPGPSALGFAWWRSVASSVTAQAHCSVYVVRVPADAR